MLNSCAAFISVFVTASGVQWITTSQIFKRKHFPLLRVVPFHTPAELSHELPIAHQFDFPMRGRAAGGGAGLKFHFCSSSFMVCLTVCSSIAGAALLDLFPLAGIPLTAHSRMPWTFE